MPNVVFVVGDIICPELDRRERERPAPIPFAEWSEFIDALRSKGGVPALEVRPWDGLREGRRGEGDEWRDGGFRGVDDLDR